MKSFTTKPNDLKTELQILRAHRQAAVETARAISKEVLLQNELFLTDLYRRLMRLHVSKLHHIINRDSYPVTTVGEWKTKK